MEYRVSFDLDKEMTEKLYGDSTTAYAELKLDLCNHGFVFCDGMYVDDEDRDVVDVITSIQQVAKRHSWFNACVHNIKLLQVESVSDLVPALDIVMGN